MKRAAVLLVVAISLAAVSASPASAQGTQEGDISVSVSFESQGVADGEQVEISPAQTEVKVVATATSENELNTLEGRLHNTTVVQGINGTSHNVSHALSTNAGPNFYSVKATDMEGNTATSTVNFYRTPMTTVEVKRVVERLEKRKSTMESEIGSLRERKESLQEENEDLRQRSEEIEEELLAFEDTTGSDGDGDGEEEVSGASEGEEQQQQGGESLPGFTAVAAIVAVTLALALVAGVRGRRRR